MSDLGTDIEHMAAGRDGIEILGKGCPIPGDPFGHGRTGNVFDTFHQLD